MKCVRCNSDRILEMQGKSSDRNHVSFKGKEQDGYLPYIPCICGGDYFNIHICLNCGQVQGTFPKAFEMEEDIEDDEE